MHDQHHATVFQQQWSGTLEINLSVLIFCPGAEASPAPLHRLNPAPTILRVELRHAGGYVGTVNSLLHIKHCFPESLYLVCSDSIIVYICINYPDWNRRPLFIKCPDHNSEYSYLKYLKLNVTYFQKFIFTTNKIVDAKKVTKLLTVTF